MTEHITNEPAPGRADGRHHPTLSANDAAAAHPSNTASAHFTAARHATAVAFVGTGVVFASWVSRITQIRSELHLTAADLGFVPLAPAVESLPALARRRGVDLPVRDTSGAIADHRCTRT